MPTSIRRFGVLGAGALVASLVLNPAPGSADPDGDGDEPTIESVEQRLSDLQHHAEVASEDLNTAREELEAARKELRTLDGDLDRKREQVETLRAQVVGTAVADYQSASTLSTATTFLLTDDPATFMDTMASSEIMRRQESALLTTLVRQQHQLAVQEEQAQLQVDAVAEDKAELAEHRQTLDERTAEAEELLDELEAEERERLLALQAERAEAAAPSIQPSRSTVRVSDVPASGVSDVPASGRAAIAVETALAQVGDAYVYGGVGPDAFDCSGLTMYAWAAAGVSLPHASGMQPSSGTQVSLSELMPGDLVFYYSPISHVALYIGNGQIVHAANPSLPVQVVPLNLMPISMAVRVG